MTPKSTMVGMLLSALLPCISVPVQASNPYLVRDINTTAINQGSAPWYLYDLNGTVFFSAKTPENGVELWKSDGTTPGTVQVKDICTGSCDSNPSSFLQVNGTLYFAANDGIHGSELWKSDGTEAGTVMVKDVVPGSGGTVIQRMEAAHGLLYYVILNSDYTSELWKSDGTGVNTVFVKRINDNPYPPNSYSPYLVNVNGTLYFTSWDNTFKNQLWKIGAAGSSPAVLLEIPNFESMQEISDLANVNGTLFFAANNGTSGMELWKSDGTPGGTVVVRDIVAGAGGSYPLDMVDVGGTLFFTAYTGVTTRELWKSNGTAAGTVKVWSPPGGPFNYIRNGTSVNGTLFFAYDDGGYGDELWKSDGTAAGTVRVKDINPSGSSYPSGLITYNNTLYFSASDGTVYTALWRSDGTEAGTFMVKDILGGQPGSGPINLAVSNGSLFFSANDGIHGSELWKSSGSASDTLMIKDINPSTTLSSTPGNLTLVNGLLYFTAYDGPSSGTQLWKSNGTLSGTTLVKEVNPGFSALIGNMADVNGTLFFTADDGLHGSELWASDGTPSGTMMVKDIVPGPGSSNSYYLTNVNGTLFFVVDDGVNGNELWKSDGSSGGTSLVADIGTGTIFINEIEYPFSSSNPASLTPYNGLLVFSAEDNTRGRELWKSDGTPTGTVQIKDICTGGASSNPNYITNVNGTLFFVTSDCATGSSPYSLWKSDGSGTGTVAVKTFSDSLQPGSLTNVNGTLFFALSNGPSVHELWKSDGTESGTTLIVDTCPGKFAPQNGSPQNLVDVNGTLFFTGWDDVNGRQIWKSDGTGPGTQLVKVIPYASPYFSWNLINDNGTLYFNSPEPGNRLWKSDGTAAGTGPAYASAYPNNVSNILAAGNIIYFAGDDATRGNELFALTTAVSINSNTEFTISRTVTLELTCPFSGGCSQMVLSNDCIFDTEPWEAYATTREWLLSDGDGRKSVCVKFKDTAGNESPVFRNETVTYDTTPPDTTIDTFPAARTTGTSATFTFSSSDPAAGFQCWLDEAPDGFQFCTSPANYTVYGGTHAFQVRAIDPAGNADPTPARYDWQIVDAALKSGYSWGHNWQGELGIGATDNRAHALVENIAGPSGFIRVRGGMYHSVAQRSDGTVWSWGNNQYSQLGNGTAGGAPVPTPAQIPGLTGVVSISAGALFSLALKQDGTVWEWGTYANRSNVAVPRQVYGIDQVVAIATGYDHAMAVRSDGTVWVWGKDDSGELGLGKTGFIQTWPTIVPGTSSVTTVAAVGNTSFALKGGGTLWSWGSNTGGLLGTGPTPFFRSSPAQVTVGASVIVAALATGSSQAMHFHVIDSNGTAWGWGYNHYGQLGLGTISATSYDTPQMLTTVSAATGIAVGGYHTIFRNAGGSLLGAGKNDWGQIGGGLYDHDNHPLPERVGYLGGIIDIAAGSDFSLAVGSSWITSAPLGQSFRHSSLVVDAADNLNVLYTTFNTLKFASSPPGGTWSTSTVINGAPFIYYNGLSLAVDGSGNRYACYTERNDTAGTRTVKYIATAGGIWQTPEAIGGDTSYSEEGYCDIAVRNGTVYISYFAHTTGAGCGDLRLARKISSGPWEQFTVESGCPTGNKQVGEHNSIAVDPSDTVHISYAFRDMNTSPYYVKYARGNGASWSLTQIDAIGGSATGGGFTSIALNGGNPAFSYSTRDLGLEYTCQLRYASYNGTAWSTESVDDYSACVGWGTSLAFTGNQPLIAYYDYSNEDLKIAHKSGATWLITAADTDGNVGMHPSLAVDSLGTAHVSYSDETNQQIMYAKSADSERPTGGFTINSGGSFVTNTSTTLNLNCSDGVGVGCWQMKVSNDGIFDNETEEPFTSSKPWTLTSDDGPKTIYVKYKDGANNWSPVYSRSVTLDTQPPTGSVLIDAGATSSNSFLILLDTVANDANTVAEMSLSNDGSTWFTYPYAPSFAWSLAPGVGNRTVSVKYKDAAGNWSTPMSDSIFLDGVPPLTTATPGGKESSTTVSITLSCDDSSGSGCASTYYTTDGTVPTTASTRYTGTPIALSGATSPMLLRFFSVDSLGNTESYKTETYTFVAGYTTLTLDLASPTLLQNGLLDVSGKLTRYPDSEAVPNNGMDLSGLPVALTVTGPAGSPCEGGCTENTTTYSSLGHYRFQGLDRFSFKGTYTLQAGFAGTGLHQASQSGSEALLVGASAGYAIIVEGKVSSEEGLESHNKTTGRVYEALKERGFVDDNIMYFNYAGTVVPGVDAVPAKSAIQAAIETWAAERMNGAPAPLYVIFVDHGNQNTFYIDPSTITPAELNGWLDSMETALSASARLEKRVVILGACYSGSFLDTLKQAAVPGVDAGRIVISSAAADEQSYKGPNEPDGIRSGEFFIEELFKQLRKGSSFKAAFVEAAALTRTFTSQGSDTGNSANGYGDTSVQHPLLDDDGNGIGSNTLVDGMGDGIEADLLHLGFGVTNASLGPADIKAVSATHYLGSGSVSTPAPLWLEPYSNGAVSSGWFEVKAPTTLLSGTGGSGQLALDIPKVLMELKVSGRWEPVAGADPTFTTAGKYEVYYFTKSTNAEISEMKRSLVYKNYAGNGLPAAFDLVSPGAGGLTEKTRTELNLVWNASGDPDGLTYTVQVATDSGFTDIVHQKEEIGTTWYYVDESAALSDKTVFYWRVLAVDTYGAIRPSNQVWSFETDNTNALPGQIRGYVYDGLSDPVTGATVTAMLGAGTVAQTSSGAGGAFVFVVPPGTYTLNATAAGYTGGSSGSISLASGGVQNTSVTIIITNPTLQVTVSGSGCGTVTSAPAGISCISGSTANCSAPYPNGTPVTMTASPDWKSLFSGWSDAYTGMTNPVEITMNANKTLAAAFTPNLQARVGATGYASLQEAYDNLATLDGSIIMAREYTFLEPGLLFNSSKTVTIDGGWDSGYSLQTGMTTIDGTLTVRNGRLNIRNLVVK